MVWGTYSLKWLEWVSSSYKCKTLIGDKLNWLGSRVKLFQRLTLEMKRDVVKKDAFVLQKKFFHITGMSVNKPQFNEMRIVHWRNISLLVVCWRLLWRQIAVGHSFNSWKWLRNLPEELMFKWFVINQWNLPDKRKCSTWETLTHSTENFTERWIRLELILKTILLGKIISIGGDSTRWISLQSFFKSLILQPTSFTGILWTEMKIKWRFFFICWRVEKNFCSDHWNREIHGKDRFSETFVREVGNFASKTRCSMRRTNGEMFHSRQWTLNQSIAMKRNNRSEGSRRPDWTVIELYESEKCSSEHLQVVEIDHWTDKDKRWIPRDWSLIDKEEKIESDEVDSLRRRIEEWHGMKTQSISIQSMERKFGIDLHRWMTSMNNHHPCHTDRLSFEEFQLDGKRFHSNNFITDWWKNFQRQLGENVITQIQHRPFHQWHTSNDSSITGNSIQSTIQIEKGIKNIDTCQQPEDH